MGGGGEGGGSVEAMGRKSKQRCCFAPHRKKNEPKILPACLLQMRLLIIVVVVLNFSVFICIIVLIFIFMLLLFVLVSSFLFIVS